MKKRILVNGACGKMGQEVVKTVVNELDDQLVAACDRVNIGKNIMDMLSLEGPEIIIGDNLTEMIRETSPDVIVDFTTPRVVMENIEEGLTNGVNMIVGTTGITEIDLEKIEMLTRKNKVNALIIPNFAIGAILMMKFAREAAHYLDSVEIIELHHDKKLDAPSGTALKTA
ncbi:MAG TPA: 4-hydroxy-tetrahydrodipicolinate reductase, partial [Halanaerobiales bacterium]|nr:4-hydroxy-tetrahydrodipicolinate reductase [Halanaerobiales bacterium]